MKKIILALVFLIGIGVSYSKEKIVKITLYKISQSDPHFIKKIEVVDVMGMAIFEMTQDGTTPGENKDSRWAEKRSFTVVVPTSDLKNWKNYVHDYFFPKKPIPTPETSEITP